MSLESQRTGRGIALSIFNIGSRWRCVVNSTPQPLNPQEGPPVPIVQEAGWAPVPVWTDVEKRKFFALTGV